MDFDKILENLRVNLPFLLAIIGFILLQFFLKRRKPQATQRDIAENLLAEVRVNQALVQAFDHFKKPKRFEVTNWNRSKNKLDFLDQSVKVVLADAFTMAEELNRQIGMTQKHDATSHMVTFDVTKLEKPLTKSREGLEQWLVTKVDTKKPPTKYPGVFDDFSGRKG